MSLSSPEIVTFDQEFDQKNASVNPFGERSYSEEPPVFAPIQTLDADTKPEAEKVLAENAVAENVVDNTVLDSAAADDSATEKEMLSVAIASRGMLHAAALLLTQRLFIKRIGWTVFVKVQDPVQLDEQSTPKPDIAIVKLDRAAYSVSHPTPADIYLTMEIADAGLEHDLEVKSAMYAAADIAEYWVLDVIERKLHVLREPASDDNAEGLGHHYNSHIVVDEWGSIAPLAFTKVAVTVADMLPPRQK